MAVRSETGLFIRVVGDYGAEVPVANEPFGRGRQIVRVRLEGI